MSEYKHSQAKKSAYLFLSLLLGVFLFLILHRLIIFFIIIFSLTSGHSGFYANFYRQFLIIDFSTLLLAVLAGSWYGLWVGGYWYEKVYETGTHGGALAHLAARLNWFSKRQNSLRNKVEAISRELRTEAWQFEDLAKTVPKKPVARTFVKKQATIKRTLARKS
jgi:hypothetical protein